MTWLELRPDEPFGLATLPYGIASTATTPPSVTVRVGDHALDLAPVAAAVGRAEADVLATSSLNALMALGPDAWSGLRSWVRSLLDDESAREIVTPHLHAVEDITLHLPVEVADYVDFYASERHARNVGAIFRPESPDLPPNWKHLPIGYHGRAGTVVVTGTDVARPRGQRRTGPDAPPVFGPSIRLDIECEVGFLVGVGTELGTSVSVAGAASHLFGVVLLNDWSARDIQAWEYVPLGPFLGKSFATSISGWVVPWEALAAAGVAAAAQDPPVLGYLEQPPGAALGLDLHLEVVVNGTVVSRPEFRDMYWTPSQMLAHLTVNGASLRVGDLFGSGTVSSDDQSAFGSLLELSWNATRPLTLADGTQRGFLEDGDSVTLRGWAPGPDGSRVTLGEVTGRVRPPR